MKNYTDITIAFELLLYICVEINLKQRGAFPQRGKAEIIPSNLKQLVLP